MNEEISTDLLAGTPTSKKEWGRQKMQEGDYEKNNPALLHGLRFEAWLSTGVAEAPGLVVWVIQSGSLKFFCCRVT